jgi:hypothetical protein
LIKKFFTIKELGILHKHLGVQYKWGEDKTGQYLEASMEDFVTFMIEDFKKLLKKLPQTTRMTQALSGTILRKMMGMQLYTKNIVPWLGSVLLYFVKKIGPVCANSCQELSEHLENPGEAQWNAVERLLGYISMNICHRKLKIRPPRAMRVQDVVDSSFGDNPDTQKSTSAYMGTISGSALINWFSKGQPIVTVSSTEAEYMALSDGSKKTTFITNLLTEVKNVRMPSLLSEDNTGAIFLSKNPQIGSRTKHIDVRYHFI